MAKHQNLADCPKCDEIMNKYPGLNANLKSWFIAFRGKYKVFHCSEAGRGQVRQNLLYEERTPEGKRKTKAKYGYSAHNWNAALDTFLNIPGADMYDEDWYRNNLEPEIPGYLEWYGVLGSAFPELPHIEVRDWKKLALGGYLKLVEEPKVPVKLRLS